MILVLKNKTKFSPRRLTNKVCFLLLTCIYLSGCSSWSKSDSPKILQARVDSLFKLTDDMKEQYKPDLADIMLGIQVHHSKLWFAGINENWKLAQFEIVEVKEAFEKIEELYPIHDSMPIAQLIPAMISSNIVSMEKAIEQKNKLSFIEKYNALSNSCNNCHKEVKKEFNVITTPDHNPFPDQVFKNVDGQ